jgi:hypothetical protein
MSERPHAVNVGRLGGTGCQAVGMLSAGVAGSGSFATANGSKHATATSIHAACYKSSVEAVSKAYWTEGFGKGIACQGV